MALATIPLSIELQAKIAGFQRDMQAGVGIAQTSAKSIAGAFTAVSGAVTALVGTAFVAGIATMVTSSANAVDSFNDLRDSTGASIENISALDRIARETGGSFDTVASSLVKFNGVLNKTDEDGNAAAAVFKALGLNAEELKKMDPAEALLKTAIAFNSVADDGNKARAAQILFGKSLQEIAPFLKDLAEKGKLVATTTAEQAEQAENYNKQIARMKANHEDLVRNIASSVLPTLNNLLEKLQTAGGFTGSIKIRLGLDDQSKAESELAAIQQKADTTKTAIDSMTEALARSPGDDNLVVRLAKAKDRYADLGKQLFVAADRLKAAANAASPLPAATVADDKARPSLNLPKAEKKNTAAPIDQQAKTYAELVTSIKAKIAASELELTSTVALTEAQKLQIDINKLVADGKIKAEDASSGEIKALVEKTSATSTAVALQKEESAFIQARTNAAYAAANARYKELESLAESNTKLAEEIELIGKDEALQRTILRARESSTIAIKAEQLARLDLAGACTVESEALREEIDLLRERQGLGDTRSTAIITEADTKVQKQYTDDLKKDLAGAFGDALKSTSNPIEAFALSLANTVAARLSASLAESFADAALQAAGLGSSGGGGLFGGLLSAVSATVFSGGTGAAGAGTSTYSLGTGASSLSGIKIAGGRASGGAVDAGALYRINERGPEVLDVGGAQYLMMGKKGGNVIPNGGAAGQGASQPINVYITNTVGDVATQSMLRDANAATVRQIQSGLARSMKYGGAMA